ncbi:MAG: stage II sporulation protein M [Massiliimalia sp.]
MRTSGLETEHGNTERNSFAKPKIFSGKYLFGVMLGVFVLGMMYGSILLQQGDGVLFDSLSQIQKGFLETQKTGNLLRLVCESLCSSGLFFLITFLMGFSAIGQPVCFCIPFIRGLGLGSSISYFYLYYSYTGIGYCAVVMLPGMVLSVFALIVSARESIRFSNSLLQCFGKNGNKMSQTALRLYIMKHFVLFGVLVLSSLLDGVLSVLFSGLFHLA